MDVSYIYQVYMERNNNIFIVLEVHFKCKTSSEQSPSIDILFNFYFSKKANRVQEERVIPSVTKKSTRTSLHHHYLHHIERALLTQVFVWQNVCASVANDVMGKEIWEEKKA